MLHKCYGENLTTFAAQPSNLNLVLHLGNLQVEIKKYKNNVLLGGNWINVISSPKGVFCLLSSLGTSLISVSQGGTGVCSSGGGIGVDIDTDFKAHDEFMRAPALNISLR